MSGSYSTNTGAIVFESWLVVAKYSMIKILFEVIALRTSCSL